jgi:hypothetical protein
MGALVSNRLKLIYADPGESVLKFCVLWPRGELARGRHGAPRRDIIPEVTSM